MYYLLTFILGLVAGAAGATIYYRRNIAPIESALSDAKKSRDDMKARLDDILGGKK